MSKITNTGSFEGGYFILNPDLKLGHWKRKEGLFVTLPYESSIKEKILELIRNSKSSIKICSFILTDNEIFEELGNVLSKSDVAVFIITQLDDSRFSTTLLTDEEMTDNHFQTHLDVIKKLYSLGAHIRASQTAHAKFVISDRLRSLVMSSNLTKPSLENNPETGVVLSDYKTCVGLDRLFDIVFQHGTEYTKFLTADRNKQFIVSRSKHINSGFLLGLNTSQLRYTYENLNHSLYEEILRLVADSSQEIYISTYSIVGLEHLPELVSVIQEKINAGVRIYLFCRGMNYRPDHLRGCNELSKLGCYVFGDIYNHSKGIVGNAGSIIFSANIDGNHGLKNGFEVGSMLDGNQSSSLSEFIKWQISSAPYIFKLSPSKTEYFDSYAFYCREKNINPIELPENLKISAKSSAIVDQIDKTPSYIKIKDKKITQITIGKNTYKANYKDSILSVGDNIDRPEYNLESYLFHFKTLELIQ